MVCLHSISRNFPYIWNHHSPTFMRYFYFFVEFYDLLSIIAIADCQAVLSVDFLCAFNHFKKDLKMCLGCFCILLFGFNSSTSKSALQFLRFFFSSPVKKTSVFPILFCRALVIFLQINSQWWILLLEFVQNGNMLNLDLKAKVGSSRHVHTS